MQLVLVGDLAVVREKYIEVIEHTKDMKVHARWIYGQHPTDAMIQSYIDGQEMYLFMDGQNVAGMTAITMYQEKGKKAIRLDALASNIPAQHMYEKLGFAYRGKQNLYAENTGWTDFLYYELPLQAQFRIGIS